MPVDLPNLIGSYQLLIPSLQVGTATGITGLAFGAVYGTFKSPNPSVFAVTSTITSFLYGSGAFYARGVILAYQGQERTRQSELFASGGGGLTSGALLGAAFNRNAYSALRTGALSAAVALTCQAAYHNFVLPTNQPRPQTSFIDRVAAKMPFQSIPDAEYEVMLSKQISQIDDEMSILDQRIANLRRQSVSLGESE